MSSKAVHFYYALPALPLACFALPVYVHVPKLYAEEAGMSLALIGAVLLLARLLDAGLDPWLGQWSERHLRRSRALWLSLPLLMAGGLMLFMPTAGAGATWLLCALILAYGGYALASINHQAWGAEYPENDSDRLRATGWREAATLVGVMAAAALPSVLAPSLADGVTRLFAGCVVALLVSFWFATRNVPERRGAVPAAAETLTDEDAEPSVWQLWKTPAVTRLFLVSLLNGIAAAVPATLVLFYVSDVLAAEAYSGLFLLLYFIAGALAIPGWVRLAEQIGRVHAWQIGMALALAGFLLAPWLGAGDAGWFALVCLVSGAALGADLALPPALLAEHVARNGQGSITYGWWASLNKFNLALAAGLALPLAAALGYQPGDANSNVQALAWLYGGLPLCFKGAALLLLYRQRTLIKTLEPGVRKC